MEWWSRKHTSPVTKVELKGPPIKERHLQKNLDEIYARIEKVYQAKYGKDCSLQTHASGDTAILNQYDPVDHNAMDESEQPVPNRERGQMPPVERRLPAPPAN